MRRTWIIGAGGLLGSALRRALHMAGDQVFIPADPLPWLNEERLLVQLEAAVLAFAGTVGAGDTWELYWSAGIGTFASTAEDMQRETVALETFLRMLETQPALLRVPGAIGFASSAGAIYAGAIDQVITEDSAVAPTTAYAHAKLAQEALIRAFTERQAGIRVLVGRISTLYGVGQATQKNQGLLTHIARSIIRNRPIQIYVPFDTIRDYINATDAAVRLVMILRQEPCTVQYQMRLIASENPTTIAEIIAVFKRLSRHTPRVVTSVSRSTALYTRRVQFRSLAPAGPFPYPSTSLIVGVGQLMQAERFYFAQPARA
jgi:UDP-glucose 4-epimerase